MKRKPKNITFEEIIKKSQKKPKKPLPIKEVEKPIDSGYGFSGKWHKADEKQPKVESLKALYETKCSKRVLVRWRFKNSAGKWRYSFARFYHTKKDICGPWWSIENASGIVEVSHWAYIKKPNLR